jgi:glycosyltransferase involved in cell wall biosynthesis
MSATMKVGFVLLSSSIKPQPSTRIAALNMLPFLHAAGIQAELVFDPLRDCETPDIEGLAQRLIAEKFDVVIFQKVHGPSVMACVRELSRAGIGTIYSVCDVVDAEMTDLSDMSIVVTDFLKNIYPIHLHHKIRVVHDGIESPEVQKKNWSNNSGSRSNPIRAILVTSSSLTKLPILLSPPSWLEVTIVGRYPSVSAWSQRLSELRWKFARMASGSERLAYVGFLANHRIKTEMWQARSVYSALQNADVGILPIETTPILSAGETIPSWKIKSENRLTLKMAVGLPVIATPIPSYEPVIETGKNGFLASSNSDWTRYLTMLRDPVIRCGIGNTARTSVISRYSMQEQARLLTEAIYSVFSVRSEKR